MNEELTPEEVQQLSEALEDGFKDDYLPKAPLQKVEMGKLFDTNPLGNEVVFYQVRDPFDEALVRSAASEDNRDELDLFEEESWESNIFWRNSFGFNFDKIAAFFQSKHDDVIEEYRNRYARYLGEEYPNNGFEKLPRSFEQWIEGRIFPYTKRWFEHHILDLIKGIYWSRDQLQNQLNNASDDPEDAFRLRRDFWSDRLFRDALILGRMVEHYRWKFQYEAGIIARQHQHSAAGSGGARASRSRRNRNLETLMQEIENLQSAAGLFSEDRLVDQAIETARERDSSFPKSKKTLDDYGTALRSEEPFKTRYEAVFRKNA